MNGIMARILVSVAAISFAAVNVEAQQSEQSIPPEVTDKLANDLAKLQSEIQAAQQQASIPLLKQREVEVTRDGWVFGGADTDAPKEFAAHKGQSLKVLDKAGNFYAVYDSTAGKTGWVPVADVKPRFNKWDWDFDDPSIGSKNYISPSSDKMSSGNASNNASSDNNSYLFKKITDAAVQFRESYRNNQYIQVTGFTVKLGIPPALDLAFGFK
jgi:hypothetical protein